MSPFSVVMAARVGPMVQNGQTKGPSWVKLSQLHLWEPGLMSV